MPEVRLGWTPLQLHEIRRLSEILYRSFIVDAAASEVFDHIWEYWVNEFGVPVPPSCPPWESPTVQERAARSRLFCSLVFYGRAHARAQGVAQHIAERVALLSAMVKYQETPFGAAMEAYENEDGDD